MGLQTNWHWCLDCPWLLWQWNSGLFARWVVNDLVEVFSWPILFFLSLSLSFSISFPRLTPSTVDTSRGVWPMPPILWGFSFPSSRAWPGTIQFSEAICFRNVDDEDIKASSSWAPLLLHLLPSAAAAAPPPLPLPPLPPPPPPNVYLWTGSSSSIDRLCPPELLLVVNYYSIKFSRVMISFNEVIQIWKLSQLNRSLYQPESVRWWEGLQGLQDEYCQYEYSEEAMNNVWIEYRALQTKQNGEPKKKKRWNKIAPSGSLRSSRWETCNNGVHVDHLRGSFMCGFFTFSFSGRTCIFFSPSFSLKPFFVSWFSTTWRSAGMRGSIDTPAGMIPHWLQRHNKNPHHNPLWNASTHAEVCWSGKECAHISFYCGKLMNFPRYFC